MIKNIHIIILTFLVVGCTIDEKIDPSKSFVKFYGSDKEEFASKLIIDSDQNLVFIGTSSSYGAGATDIMVIKTDNEGNKIWEKYFGGLLSDSGTAIRQTSDGGYIIIGNKLVNDTTKNTNILLIKLDNSGNKVFEKEIFRLNASVSAYDIIETRDGGFAIGASVIKKNILPTDGLSNILLIRTDAQGNETLFYRDFGIQSSFNAIKSIFQKGGDTIFVLNNRIFPSDFILNTPSFILTRPLVSIGFDATKSSPNISEENIVETSQMIETSDGGYIAIGSSIKTGVNADLDICILKLDRTGRNKLWFKQFDFPDLGVNSIERGGAIVQLEDGSYGIVGTKNVGDQSDIVVAKISSNGDLIWSKLYGGQGNDIGKDIKITKDGSFIILSTFSLVSSPENRKVVNILKLNSQGELKN